jgi:hypothetical protein
MVHEIVQEAFLAQSGRCIFSLEWIIPRGVQVTEEVYKVVFSFHMSGHDKKGSGYPMLVLH